MGASGALHAQDPHFKASMHRRRIISRAQLADYAYLLAPGGMLYTITDVPDLGAWMREKVPGFLCAVCLHGHTFTCMHQCNLDTT